MSSAGFFFFFQKAVGKGKIEYFLNEGKSQGGLLRIYGSGCEMVPQRRPPATLHALGHNPHHLLTCSWRMQIFPSGPMEVRRNIAHIWLLDQRCPIDLTVMVGMFYHLPCPLWQPAATAYVKCD